MGITGLLPFLEKATKPCHISEFRGATVAVDTYCWLHKGATACAIQLAQGETTKVYVDYCMKYVKMLLSYDIHPILVFDGKNLPAKAETDVKRRELRHKAKHRAAELLHLGKTDEARSYLKQSVNITPEMASEVIKQCHKINVDCIVAPYESDAELAYFNIKGIAEVVITEDSDLVLFGCTKVMYKLDQQGVGYLVESENIPMAMKIPLDKYTFDKFRFMCILSGCDYINSLPGIGLKKAEKFILLTEETNPEIFLDKIPRYLNMPGLKVTSEYKDNFMLADATFRHQTVFDPFKKRLIPLTDPQASGTNLKYCKNVGDIFDDKIAYQVALGNLHPTTFKKLNDWSPSKAGSSNSIWCGVYKKNVSWKEQKAQFREYFSAKTKVENKTYKIDDERIKTEEDERINKELEFDQKSVVILNDGNIQIEANKIENQETVSPVLNRNPFIKKLSKFKRTKTDSNIVIKSRFFFYQSEEPKNNKWKLSQDSIKIEEAMESQEECDIKCSRISDIENTPVNENIECRAEELSKIKLGDSFNISNKGSCSNIIGLIDLSLDEPDVMEKKSESKEEGNNKSLSSLVKSSGESGTLKRKKLGQCRSIGLKRTKLEGQQTIHNFFGKMRK